LRQGNKSPGNRERIIPKLKVPQKLHEKKTEKAPHQRQVEKEKIYVLPTHAERKKEKKSSPVHRK